MSQAFLILCHQAPTHLHTWATQHPEARFYVHYDAKYPLEDLAFLNDLANVHLLQQRIAIHWAGYSMVRATLNLIQTALNDPQNQYFHLLSGNCIPLKTPNELTEQCQKQPENTLWLTSQHTPRLRYRTRFNAPHADTAWQRSIAGKILTKSLQLADQLIPSQRTCLSGSQWFSATRTALNQLMQHNSPTFSQAFNKKLCPDEHYFQYLAQEAKQELHIINDHHRYLRFAPQANHPDNLTLNDIQHAQQQNYWFARKANPNDITQWLKQTHNQPQHNTQP